MRLIHALSYARGHLRADRISVHRVVVVLGGERRRPLGWNRRAAKRPSSVGRKGAISRLTRAYLVGGGCFDCDVLFSSRVIDHTDHLQGAFRPVERSPLRRQCAVHLYAAHWSFFLYLSIMRDHIPAPTSSMNGRMVGC